jgi:hypothetical protein
MQWLSKVSELKTWFNEHNKCWPRKSIHVNGVFKPKEELTEDELQEVKLGLFRGDQRRGKRALDTNQSGKSLRGITRQRIEILNRELPDWDSESWEQKVEDLVAWRASHPNRWPRQAIFKGERKRKTMYEMTANELEEVHIGMFLRELRGGKIALDKVMTGKLLKGMTQERAKILNDKVPGWDESKFSINLALLIKWRDANPERWPRELRGEDIATPEEKLEKRMNTFLGNMRRPSANKEQTQILDEKVPGWNPKKDPHEDWSARLADLATWCRARRGRWPVRSTRVAKKKDKTPDQLLELNLAGWHSEQRKTNKQLRAWLLENKDGDQATMPDGLREMMERRLPLLNKELPGWDSDNLLWQYNMKEMKQWCADILDRWPRQSIASAMAGRKKSKEEMNESEKLEVMLGVWLSNLRSGKRAIDEGKTDAKTLKGMTPEWAKSMDTTFPGWTEKKRNPNVGIIMSPPGSTGG